MAGGDKRPIIVVKKKISGGHGHHGGAWKVAYADFVTAMMCFFLVLWLLGADEEVKLSVSNYFNNPTGAWRPDLASKATVPLGAKTGAGESVLNGLEGGLNESLVQLPNHQFYIQPEETRDYGESIKDILKHQTPDVDMTIELMRFSVPERALFQVGKPELTQDAPKLLEKFGKLLKKQRGTLSITGYTSPAPDDPNTGSALKDPYEFSIARVVALTRYFTKGNFIDEGDIATNVADQSRSPAAQGGERIIEFIIKQKNAD